jgi:hypothetical protein
MTFKKRSLLAWVLCFFVLFLQQEETLHALFHATEDIEVAVQAAARGDHAPVIPDHSDCLQCLALGAAGAALHSAPYALPAITPSPLLRSATVLVGRSRVPPMARARGPPLSV